MAVDYTQPDVVNMMRAQSEYDDAKKSSGVAYLLWFALGVVGAHRFYLGNKGMGIAMILTLGGLGVWTLIDVFFIGKRLSQVNQVTKQRIFAQHQIGVA
jgi:TM2 domain-containing membrane protein YozV